MLIVIKKHVTQFNNEGFRIVDNEKAPYLVTL